jgi:pimeloyl-ACP methyl ester carboxylesterase
MPPFFELPSSAPVLELFSHLPMSTSLKPPPTRVDPMQSEKPSDTPKMKRAPVIGGELEYEVRGDGKPVLLIHGSHIAGALLPLMSEPSLENYRLIRYHRRGFVGSTKHDSPCSLERQAADALALLRYLGVKRAHIAGHSYGGVIAMQLACDAPDVVHSLMLLEPALVMVPCGAEFAIETVAPSMERYQAGDGVGAEDAFMRGVSGANWRDDTARTVPGGPEQAERDAATFFEVEMPALGQWKFDDAKAKQISQPILHVLGSESGALFKEGRDLVHSWFPQSEDYLVQGVMHGLQIQDPQLVASGIANFLRRHPIQ